MSQSASVKLRYRGRFAPSPTGPLHFGSLVSAVASFLQAKSQQGAWLLRVEDLDPPRESPGSMEHILRTLEQHHLHWDEPIVYQSRRFEFYEHYLERLNIKGYVYACDCSRKTISELQQQLGISVYPGTCRQRQLDSRNQHALRLKTPDHTIAFDDRIQGHFTQNLARQVGDFVLRRADGWFAYQLAVVVDDTEQGITEVVRGSDLLDNTPRQMFIQSLLDFSLPSYAHVPVATHANGEKLSKQTYATPVDSTRSVQNLVNALAFLGQTPPAEHEFSHVDDVINWAIEHWDITLVPKQAKKPTLMSHD